MNENLLDIEREERKKHKQKGEADLMRLFHVMLRELDLPSMYLHQEDKESKEIDYRRQQAGVRLREAYELGQRYAHERRMERGSKLIDALFAIDFLVCPEQFEKYANPTIRERVNKLIEECKKPRGAKAA